MSRLSPRFVFAALSIVSVGLLVSGLMLGAIEHLDPCYLCNFQRLLYLVVALLSACAAVHDRWHRFWATLLGLVAVWGVASATEQSWMQHYPDQVNECGFSDPTLVETIVDRLAIHWPDMFMVTGLCTVKDWVFLGLSLANWSALCFLALAGVAFWQVFRRY
jgi:disulfide bond formation protein DsbB